MGTGLRLHLWGRVFEGLNRYRQALAPLVQRPPRRLRFSRRFGRRFGCGLGCGLGLCRPRRPVPGPPRPGLLSALAALVLGAAPLGLEAGHAAPQRVSLRGRRPRLGRQLRRRLGLSPQRLGRAEGRAPSTLDAGPGGGAGSKSRACALHFGRSVRVEVIEKPEVGQAALRGPAAEGPTPVSGGGQDARAAKDEIHRAVRGVERTKGRQGRRELGAAYPRIRRRRPAHRALLKDFEKPLRIPALVDPAFHEQRPEVTGLLLGRARARLGRRRLGRRRACLHAGYNLLERLRPDFALHFPTFAAAAEHEPGSEGGLADLGRLDFELRHLKPRRLFPGGRVEREGFDLGPRALQGCVELLQPASLLHRHRLVRGKLLRRRPLARRPARLGSGGRRCLLEKAPPLLERGQVDLGLVKPRRQLRRLGLGSLERRLLLGRLKVRRPHRHPGLRHLSLCRRLCLGGGLQGPVGQGLGRVGRNAEVGNSARGGGGGRAAVEVVQIGLHPRERRPRLRTGGPDFCAPHGRRRCRRLLLHPHDPRRRLLDRLGAVRVVTRRRDTERPQCRTQRGRQGCSRPLRCPPAFTSIVLKGGPPLDLPTGLAPDCAQSRPNFVRGRPSERVLEGLQRQDTTPRGVRGQQHGLAGRLKPQSLPGGGSAVFRA
mmetsp:Transcript_39751/g.89015  ORF Transcript_39751/g.89015 Transcript_39751/m.89015 type:complete len:656 (-) Transcript_39751:644-2611(-)